jgi:hypothetical protein
VAVLARESGTRRLIDANRTGTLVFRCFCYSPSGGVFRAECIDLDLAVEKDTPDAAWHGLQTAIGGFVNVALEDGDAHNLLSRRSPFGRRLLYRWFCLQAALFRHRPDLRICDFAWPTA